MRVVYSKEEKKWIELEKGNKEGIYLDRFLKEKLDNVKFILKKNWDCVILIDGMERSGKSTLAMLIGYYLTDGELKIDQMCTGSSEDTIYKLEHLPNNSLMIIDEGSLSFASTDTLKKETKQLHKILNIIGQKNMVLIIVAPSFFNLTRYISVERSRFLLHCYTDRKMNRGKFTYFGEKKKKLLYTIGKKNFNSYSKPTSDFVGRFNNFNPLGDEYIKVKEQSMMVALRENDKECKNQKNVIQNQKDFIVGVLRQNEKKGRPCTYAQLASVFNCSPRTLSNYWAESRANRGGVKVLGGKQNEL